MDEEKLYENATSTGDCAVDRQRRVKPLFQCLPNELEKISWHLKKYVD
jgi:hypothetical protein